MRASYDDEGRRLARRIDRHRKPERRGERERMATAMKAQTMAPKSGVDVLSDVLAEECRKAGLPANTFERDPPEDAAEHSPIPLKASPTFPRTTSAQIGHRSSRMEYSLEFVGRLYISPRWTIDPPVETAELRATQQKFIFLG
ncbi:uncharacterized protein [Temnothorax nylanderi]|uniref:uncharacterized protein n=1 Tax=Temnothorax nylanderi TaxID=102681 RepID=UPI003A8B3E7A